MNITDTWNTTHYIHKNADCDWLLCLGHVWLVSQRMQKYYTIYRISLNITWGNINDQSTKLVNTMALHPNKTKWGKT